MAGIAAQTERIPLEHGELLLIENWLSPAAADNAFAALHEQTAWEQSIITIAGRQLPIPRLNAWYGDPGTAYSYSGTRFEPRPWSGALASLKEAVQQTINEQLPGLDFHINSALLNLYRDGADGVGWHSDNEASLGPRPQIASLSLGGSRRFLLKPRRGAGKTAELELRSGALLLMLGELQAHWLHSIPKTRRPVEPRINVTFRQVFPGRA